MILVILRGRIAVRHEARPQRPWRPVRPQSAGTLASGAGVLAMMLGAQGITNGATDPHAATTGGAPSVTAGATCLVSGDGYFRAHVAGAVDAKIDWPNSGTQCQGESKRTPPGIRLSFQHASGGKPNLLFVFGLTGIREGQPAHATGANLTVIVQGTSRIFGTLGDSRCTVDSLTQAPLKETGYYRVEARGFCTQPAHAIHGEGDVLVSTFEFAGPVKYDADDATR